MPEPYPPTTEDTVTDQTTALALLRDAERYLSALHRSVALHDHLAANLACAGCELRDRIGDALPALAAVPLPPADPSAVVPDALRDRIAGALYERERPPREPGWDAAYPVDREVFEAMADAVLAVLSAPVDQAAAPSAVVRKTLRRWAYAAGHIESELDGAVDRMYELVARDVLRRMADETAATETQAASSANRQAFVHNAVTDALSAAGVWVPFSVRVAATRAALAEVDAWHAGEPADGAQPQPEACPPGCIACATDESHDPAPTTGTRQDGAQR